MTSPEDRAADRSYIRDQLNRHLELKDRLIRAFLIALHSRGIATVDEIYRLARSRPEAEEPGPTGDPAVNVPVARRWDETERSAIQELVLDHAARSFTVSEIDDLINLTRKREEAHSLEEIANLPAVSFGLLAVKVKSFCRLPKGQTRLSERESESARVALIRRLISDQLEFIGVAKRHLRIRDFDDLVDRIIGREDGFGVIGGKAAGMFLASKILARALEDDPKAPRIPVYTPRSFFLRSDAIEDFISFNGLQYLQDQKYKTDEEIRNEYSMILELFRNADFPPQILALIRTVLDRIDTNPLIVRSSSLLEDRFGTAFAGKYRSVFVSNQGSEEERLVELVGAISEVYASTFHPDPISYRQRHNLLDFGEDMGVIIQELVGRKLGPYYLPVWAGVAFSHNPYRRNPRIRPEDGLARIVFGLGTRAVDRVGSDFPRMIPLGLPTLRPEVQARDVVRMSQKTVDAIDLENRKFVSVPLSDLLRGEIQVPGLNLVFSSLDHEFLRPLMGDSVLGEPEDLVVTFDRFTQASPYPAFLRWCLQSLEKAYGCPVDIEFAYDGERFHLLQCRPQTEREEEPLVEVPDAVPAERRVFSSDRDVISAAVHGIEYVVLIDPQDYNNLGTDPERLTVARIVSRLNRALADHAFILMGPGRWGSQDLRLGVRVGYSDINNTGMLIEIARPLSGYMPEVSFGSHFFQDLTESKIAYLALYPEDEDSVFRENLMHGSENSLTALLPGTEEFAKVVKVIHVPAVTGGLFLNVDMDGRTQQALAYLCEKESGEG